MTISFSKTLLYRFSSTLKEMVMKERRAERTVLHVNSTPDLEIFHSDIFIWTAHITFSLLTCYLWQVTTESVSGVCVCRTRHLLLESSSYCPLISSQNSASDPSNTRGFQRKRFGVASLISWLHLQCSENG